MALKHDLEYVKLHDVTRDPHEQQEIKDLLLKNFVDLKNLFLGAACWCGSPPVILARPFFQLCQLMNIVDKKIN